MTEKKEYIKVNSIRNCTIRIEKNVSLEIEIDKIPYYVDINYSNNVESDFYFLDGFRVNGSKVSRDKIIEILAKYSNHSFKNHEKDEINKWINEVIKRYDIKEVKKDD